MKTPSRHAALMRQYLEERIYDEEAYRNWEHRFPNRWLTCEKEPGWLETKEYRRKPRTIKIGEYEVPEPMREAPDEGTWYWVAAITRTAPEPRLWNNDLADHALLALGLCHTTREAAQLHTDALLSFTKTGGKDE